MRTVRSIEPLGITRACTIVPSMNKKARITQNHEIASRAARLFHNDPARSPSLRRDITASRVSASAPTMSLHFELHQLRWVAAGVARRAESSFLVFNRLAEARQRQIAKRIRFQELPDFLDRMIGRNQLVARRRVDAVEAR